MVNSRLVFKLIINVVCHEKSSSAVKSYRDDKQRNQERPKREREKKKLDSVVVVVVVRGIMRCK
jgi:hypothetical protein